MKKVLALILLFAASAAETFILVVINLFLVYSPAVVFAVIITLGASFGISFFYILFERNFSISRKVFWLVAYLPEFAYAVFDLAMGYFDSVVLHQFYMGPGAVLIFYDVPITCGVYGLFGTGWLIFCNVMAKRKAAKCDK